MTPLSRREFLRSSALSAAALASAPGWLRAVPLPKDESGDKYITCFYQFENHQIQTLAGRDALPNGPQFLHIFSQSSPGMKPHPERVKAIHSAGKSFVFAEALDVHKYKGWMQADEKQLKEWAKQFRGQCLDSPAPADYWAFNEMPTTGFNTPNLQAKSAQWCRLIHDPGDGVKFPGVFYFTEQNVELDHWTKLSDDFWAALDETSILVVGEHYHSWEFCFSDQFNEDHLFGIAKYLHESGKKPQMNIAADKYAVLHSSYYGPKDTGWHGPLNFERKPQDVEKYLDHLLTVTRGSEFGSRRIGFGPLAAKDFDERMVAILARVLGKDAKPFVGKKG